MPPNGPPTIASCQRAQSGCTMGMRGRPVTRFLEINRSSHKRPLPSFPGEYGLPHARRKPASAAPHCERIQSMARTARWDWQPIY